MNILKPLLLLATGAVLSLSTLAGPAEDLAAAEQNLRISKETLRQIEGDLNAIKKDPSADAGVVREFENYAQRSRGIVAQHQTEVDRLRRIAPAPAPIAPAGPVLTAPRAPAYQVAKPKVDMRKEIDQDPLARLDGLLDKSIADFDAKLLREMQDVEQARTSGAAGVGAAPGKERTETAQTEGQGEGKEGTEGGENGQGQDGQVAKNGKPGQEGGKPGQEGAEPGKEGGPPGEAGTMRNGGNQQAGTRPGSAGQSTRNGGSAGTPGTGTNRTTGNRGGGTDEDIVARQLREAAERETDPVLKEKLYKEYEAYKRGR